MRFPGMLMGLVALAFCSPILKGQTTVYLPPVGAGACDITAAVGTNPTTLTIARCTKPLAVGNFVGVIALNDGPSASGMGGGFEIVGLRKIASITATTVTLTDLGGNNIST